MGRLGEERFTRIEKGVRWEDWVKRGLQGLRRE